MLADSDADLREAQRKFLEERAVSAQAYGGCRQPLPLQDP